MRALGLSPLAAFELAPPPEADESPLEPLEDLVMRALETNPQLPIADRQVVPFGHLLEMEQGRE